MGKDYSGWWFVGIVAMVALVGVFMMIGQNSGFGVFSDGGGANLLGGASTVKCLETDGGKVFSVKGTVTRGTVSRTDSCSGNNIVEYYCEEGKIKRISSPCESGCSNGACISPISITSVSSQEHVLRDGETQTYTINGRDYEVTAVFISSPIVGVKVGLDAPSNDRAIITDPIIIDPKTATAKLSINGQMTRNLGIGYSQIMGGNMKITVRNIIASERESSVTFSLEQMNADMDDLSYYPNQYFESGAFDGKIVVGQIAPTSDVVAAIDIAASLQNSSNGTFGVGIAVLDVDVPNPYILNLISVGNPCNNRVTAELMGNPDHCLQGFSPGNGIIKLFSNNGKTQIVVAGYGNDDTLGTAYVLADYKDHRLKGKLCNVRIYDLNTLEVSCESQPEICIDTDGGKNYNEWGVVINGEMNGTDLCENSIRLREYYCSNIVNKNGYFALKTPVRTALLRFISYSNDYVTFKDLSNGNDFKVSVTEGEFELILNGQSYMFTISDDRSIIKAADSTTIIPYELYNCPNGCINGACVTQSDIINLVSPNGGETFIQGQSNTISWTGGKNIVQVGLLREGATKTTNPGDYLLGWINVNATPDSSTTWDAKHVCDLMMTTCWKVSPSKYKIILVSEDENGNMVIWDYVTNKPGNIDISDSLFGIKEPEYTKVLEIVNLGSTSAPNTGSALLYGDINKMREYAAAGKRFHVKASVTHYPNNAVYTLAGEPNMVFDCAAYDYSPKIGSIYTGWITCNKIRQTITGSYNSADLWFNLPMSNIYAGQTVIATTKLYTNGVYKMDDSLFVNRAAIYTY